MTVKRNRSLTLLVLCVSPEQQATLEQAGKLARLDQPATAAINNGQTTIRLQLTRQSVSLVVVKLEGAR